MTRTEAIARIESYFDDGRFFTELARRIAIRTESQELDRRDELHHYLADEIAPSLEQLGFSTTVHPNPDDPDGPPFLLAHRHESDHRPTVLGYGHGDVVRGCDDQWREDRSPWRLEEAGDRWYGRGTADNKGQHTINLAAMANVLETRGSLGFNSTILLETGEETGSPGLRTFCTEHRAQLAADVLLASDGPRLAPERPTIFMGTRGALNFDLHLDLRDGGHHSGNWGGLLANPGVILSHAIASMIGRHGEILVPDVRPEGIPASVSAAIRELEVGGGDDAPMIDTDWGEPGLSPAERVFGWNTLEVLAFTTGNPDKPVNAIPPSARAHCQIRFVVPSDPDTMLAGIRRHLDEHGFHAIDMTVPHTPMMATRLDPDHPWVEWVAASIEDTIGEPPTVLPNLGGSLPNDIFADLLGMPTVWVPHSYAGCSQHAPDEHLLAPIAREALRVMTGLYWDLGERPA